MVAYPTAFFFPEAKVCLRASLIPKHTLHRKSRTSNP